MIKNQVHVSARRWSGNIYGNTYHTVKVWVNGEVIGVSPVSYGYGDSWMQTAGDVLRDAGLFAEIFGTDDVYAIGSYAMREAGVTSEVVDVKRRRDLHLGLTMKLTMYADFGQAWLAVPRSVYFKGSFRASPYSYYDSDFVYLEADMDAPTFLHEEKDMGREYTIVEERVNGESFIRHLPRFR